MRFGASHFELFTKQGGCDAIHDNMHFDPRHYQIAVDIVFQETGDKQFIQGRYIINHPWRGKATNERGKAYFAELPKRLEEEAQTAAKLTGWPIERIRAKQASYKDTSKEPKE